MYKKAFTLFETLIVIAITGILIVLSLLILKNADEKAYGNLYAKAYKTLNTASYNIQKDVEDYNDKKNSAAQELGNSQAPDSEKMQFPNIPALDEPKAEDLCTALVDLEKGYLNVTRKSCTLSDYTGFLSVNFKPENFTPSFTTSDGMKYYIASQFLGDYYVVLADFNGDRRPNTMRYVKNKKKPDIVPFLINKKTGVVVPTGYPVHDLIYLKARVLYANPDMDKDYSKPMTFAEARKIAYDDKTWSLDPLSVNYDSTFSSSYYTEAINRTYTGDVTTCNSNSYVTTRDFPPCMVEVDTFSK